MAMGLVLTASTRSADLECVQSYLDGFDVEVVLGSRRVDLRLADKSQRPDAIVGVTHSRRTNLASDMESLLGHAAVVPLVVIDQGFQMDHGARLIQQGAQDYLDAANLAAADLCRRIELAIVRHRPQRERIPTAALPSQDWKTLLTVLGNLPARERQVLDLLIGGAIPKQIAAKLGTKCQTVNNQIASLRKKFGAGTCSQLIILVLHTLYWDANGELSECAEAPPLMDGGESSSKGPRMAS